MTNLISFYGKITNLTDKGKDVDFVNMDFSKLLDTVTHNILLEKLVAHVLGSVSYDSAGFLR